MEKDKIPHEMLKFMAIKMYLMAALTWDYVDTIIDMAAQMKINECKAVSRQIRELRRDYDQFRASDLDDKHCKAEWELAQLFEDCFKTHFRKLHYGLKTEISKKHDLDPEWQMLVEAVQTAMTMLDALVHYAKHCDEKIKQYINAPHSILLDHFTRLRELVPYYAGDCYDKDLPSRTITAKILCNEMINLEFLDDDKDAVPRAIE